MSTCSSCGAEIIWTVTATGKRMPVDAEPVDGGNVILDDSGVTAGPRTPLATVVGKHAQPNIFGDDGPRYTSHFATCPQADEHRKATR